MTDIIGRANPDGSGRGNWSRPLRDSLAHSYYDEIVDLRQARPARYHHGWRDHLRDVRDILVPLAVLVLLGIAFWLWLAVASASQAAPA